MSLIRKSYTPPQQALIVFAVACFLMAAGCLFDKAGIMQMERLYPWSIATAFMLLFALLNSISSLSADSSTKYWGASMYSYIGLAVCTGLAAWFFSGVPVGEAESYKSIYLVVTIGFLVFISMVNFMKRIVNFAEREEWSQPRKKNK